MKVILTEDIDQLGNIGSVCEVKNGFARNFLLPKGMCVVANESKRKEFDHRMRVLTQKKQKLLGEVQALCKKLENLTLEVKKKVGEEEKIFGSVTHAELSDLFMEKSFEISRKTIQIPTEIKKLGTYLIHVKLHPEVEAKVKIKVVADEA